MALFCPHLWSDFCMDCSDLPKISPLQGCLQLLRIVSETSPLFYFVSFYFIPDRVLVEL